MLTDNTLRVLRLIDHNKQFEFNQNQAGVDPVILNKFDLTDPNYVNQLSELIYSDQAGADFLARCQCGDMEGDNKIGMTCPICGTRVTKSNLLDDNNLVCKNWLSAPAELPHGWLAPKIYLTLSKWLSYGKGKRSYLDDILDVDAPTPFDIADVVQGKGFTYLYENFDRIMDFFMFNHKEISKKPDTPAMRFCLQLNRDKIFCNYVPILNSAINPIISLDSGGQNKKRYSDVTSSHILKAAVSLSRLEFDVKKKNRHVYVERTAFKAYKDIIAYVDDATRKYVSVKKAIPRTHIFGSRYHWSFRAVIVPIIGLHRYDELHFPWQLAVNTLRVHIIGTLMSKYRLSISEAVAKQRRALQIVDPVIKEIMDKLIEDSPFPGIACVWDRPPSIRDGSVMLKFCTKIKTDLNDSCIGMSPLDVPLQNADSNSYMVA